MYGEIGRFAGGAPRAADLVDHALKVGTRHLAPLSLHEASAVQYYNIDLIGVGLAAGLVLGLAVRAGCYRCCGGGRAARRARRHKHE